MKKRHIYTYLLGVILAFAPLSTHAKAAKNKTHSKSIPIGLLVPLHGGLESYGQDILKGVELAVNDVNQASPVHFVLKTGDTQSSPEVALSSANSLISLNHVKGLIGPMSSTNALAVAKGLSIPQNTVMISYAAAAPQMGTLSRRNLFFRTIPSDEYRGITLAHLTHKKGIKRVAILYLNNDYGKAITKAFSKTFLHDGGIITKALSFEPKNDASYSAEVLQLARSKPQALVLFAYPSSGGISIMKTALEQQAFSYFITDGMKSPQVIKNLKSNVLENHFTGITPHPAVTDQQADFIKHFKKVYGHEPSNPFVLNAYDASMVMMMSILKANEHQLNKKNIKNAVRYVTAKNGVPFSFKNIKDAIKSIQKGRKLSYQGVSGNITFDAYGNIPAQNFMHWVYKKGCFRATNLISAHAKTLKKETGYCF